jgi:hypothetical protein
LIARHIRWNGGDTGDFFSDLDFAEFLGGPGTTALNLE